MHLSKVVVTLVPRTQERGRGHASWVTTVRGKVLTKSQLSFPKFLLLSTASERNSLHFPNTVHSSHSSSHRPAFRSGGHRCPLHRTATSRGRPGPGAQPLALSPLPAPQGASSHLTPAAQGPYQALFMVSLLLIRCFFFQSVSVAAPGGTGVVCPHSAPLPVGCPMQHKTVTVTAP